MESDDYDDSENLDAHIAWLESIAEEKEENMLEDFGNSKVTVKKTELLEAIKKNRDEHRATYLKANEGYRKAVIKALDETLAETRAGKEFDLARIALQAPHEHTSDYDRVIRMLEMSLADQVQITEKQFSQYVLDDWSWKAAFSTVNSTYGA